MIYDRMTHEHGYSVRRLAQKLGKDKGYIENRLRLAGAPTEIKQLVSLRKDTLSHAYELLKVEDPKRRRLAEQVASGELSLVKLRQRIEGRAAHDPAVDAGETAEVAAAGESPELAMVLAEMVDAAEAVAGDGATSASGATATGAAFEDVEIPSIDVATEHLARAVNELALALQTDAGLAEASGMERQQYRSATRWPCPSNAAG